MDEELGVILAKEEDTVVLIAEGSLSELRSKFSIYQRLVEGSAKMFKVNAITLSKIRDDSLLLNNMFASKL